MPRCPTLTNCIPIEAFSFMKSVGQVTARKRPSRKAAKSRTGMASAGPRRKLASEIAAKNAAIATELAPAVAIALLEKSEQLPGELPPALDVLAAGVSASDTDGNVRVQLLFENGAVLPVEMSKAAGSALSDALSDEGPTPKTPPRRRKA